MIWLVAVVADSVAATFVGTLVVEIVRPGSTVVLLVERDMDWHVVANWLYLCS